MNLVVNNINNAIVMYQVLLITTCVHIWCAHVSQVAFPRAKFLCHISHALQSLLTDFCGIITVNLYSRTDTDEIWINNNYSFGGHAIFGKENLVVYLNLYVSSLFWVISLCMLSSFRLRCLLFAPKHYMVSRSCKGPRITRVIKRKDMDHKMHDLPNR